MRRRRLSGPLAALSVLVLPACTGLIAGAPVQDLTTVPVSRDSAWARARRGFAAEILTIDLVDSVGGSLSGRRYPRVTAIPGSLETCHVMLALSLNPAADGTALAWDSRWLAPESLATANPKACDNERRAVMERIELTIAPPPMQ